MNAIVSKILLFLAFGGPYYQRVSDGQHVHELYRNHHDVVLGGYQQRSKNAWFEAQCANQMAIALPDEPDARRWVETCPDPAEAPKPAAQPTLQHRVIMIELGYRSVDGPFQGFSK